MFGDLTESVWLGDRNAKNMSFYLEASSETLIHPFIVLPCNFQKSFYQSNTYTWFEETKRTHKFIGKSIPLPHHLLSRFLFLKTLKLLKLFLLLITSTFLNNIVLLSPNFLELQIDIHSVLQTMRIQLFGIISHTTYNLFFPSSLSNIIGYCFWLNQQPVFTLL